MVNKSYAKSKGRGEVRSFTSIPHQLTDTRKYRSLTGNAKALLLDISSQFRGKNNGDLCATFSVMKSMGWKSASTLYYSKKELLEAGFIMVTRQGGRHCPTLFAITWKPIDDCNGKLAVKPTNIPLGTWKD
jgi:hypothetical protein